MNRLAVFFMVALYCSHGSAALECFDAGAAAVDPLRCGVAQTDTAAQLPPAAVAEVNDLKAKMRYFKAIGFHQKSEEQRQAIAAIYQRHNVPLPKEYQP
jgi:hypothetical protein